MLTVDSTSLINASQARPFVETAKRMDAPVSRLARRAKLPLSKVAKGKGLIDEQTLWVFVDQLQSFPGFELFGYQVALDHPVTTATQLSEIEISTGLSLEELLARFIRNSKVGPNGKNCLIKKEDDEIRFIRPPAFELQAAKWQAEMHVISLMIQLVRLCAPSDWLPEKIHLATKSEGDDIPPEWYGIKVVHSDATGITLPSGLLKLTVRFSGIPMMKGAIIDEKSSSTVDIEALIDRQIWRQQIGLFEAAAELEMSGTTLKRRLRESGTGYSKLLRSRRIHHACRLLSTSNLNVVEIANALGYTAVSNFSRAFTRETGSSPSQYRSNLS